MAKNKKPKTAPQAKEEERVTLEAIEAMSSSDEDVDLNEEEMKAEADALRQAIKDGAFDHVLKNKSGHDEDAAEDAVMVQDDSDASDDEDALSDEDDEESDSDREEQVVAKSNKALAAVLDEMTAAKKSMPWAETFDVIPAEPLPFVANPLDVHDDLKREVAFYNLALEAVKEARDNCNHEGVPFSRPEDFFAEMVKTDGKAA